MFILIGGESSTRPQAAPSLQPKDILFLNQHPAATLPGPHRSHPSLRADCLHVSHSKTLEQLSTPSLQSVQCFTRDILRFTTIPGKSTTNFSPHQPAVLRGRRGSTPGDQLLGRVLTQLFVEINKYNTNPSIYSFNAATTDLQMPAMVRQFILEHLDENITVERIANYFFMNKYSFMHLQALLRCQHLPVYSTAAAGGGDGDDQQGRSLTTVSRSCGFNDYSNFTAASAVFCGNPRDAAEEQAVAD